MITVIAMVLALVAGAGTYLICGNALALGRWLGVMDIPGDRKKHAHVTPLMGGVTLLACMCPAAAIAEFARSSPSHNPLVEALAWVFATVAMTMLGLFDDRRHLSARLRLLVSFLVFGILAGFFGNYRVSTIVFDAPAVRFALAPVWVSITFTIICATGLVNAVNMADGKNGLVIGLLLGWTIFLGIVGPETIRPATFIIAACLAVLLSYNLRGRIFLGDGGSYGFTTAVASLTLLAFNSPGGYAGRALAAGQIISMFAIPVIDACRLTIVRAMSGRSPGAPDRNHLHHHLQDGFGWPRGLFIYWALATLPVLIGYIFRMPTSYLMLIALGAYVLVLTISRAKKLAQ